MSYQKLLAHARRLMQQDDRRRARAAAFFILAALAEQSLSYTPAPGGVDDMDVTIGVEENVTTVTLRCRLCVECEHVQRLSRPDVVAVHFTSGCWVVLEHSGDPRWTVWNTPEDRTTEVGADEYAQIVGD